MTRLTIPEAYYEGELPEIVISDDVWNAADQAGKVTSTPEIRATVAHILQCYVLSLAEQNKGCSPRDVQSRLDALRKSAIAMVEAIGTFETGGDLPESHTAPDLARRRLADARPSLDLGDLQEQLATLVYALDQSAVAGQAGNEENAALSECILALGRQYESAGGRVSGNYNNKALPKTPPLFVRWAKPLVALVSEDSEASIANAAKKYNKPPAN